MAKSFTKRIGPFFLLCIVLNTTATTERTWCNEFVKNHFSWLTAGAAVILIVGKTSYNYYQKHRITHEQIIENCRLIYKKIHHDIHHYHYSYHNNAQMSDWDLKEMIMEKNNKPYPFITYYASLTKDTWLLKKHLATISDQLKKINDHRNKLRNNRTTEKTTHLQEMLAQLIIKGKHLQEYLTKTITLITILKKRVKNFREYNDDCYNWAQGERSITATLICAVLHDQEHAMQQ